MSEQLRNVQEHKSESIDTSVETDKNLERIHKAALEAMSEKAEIDELEDIVEQKATSKDEIKVDHVEKNDGYIYGLHEAMKVQTYSRSLERVRSKLSPAEKIGSKIIHQPAVDSVSNGLAKTAARPSGILGGGLTALIGSSFLLYMSRHYGFTYNFFTFFALLAIGFVLGITLELALYSLRKSNR